MNGLEDNYPPGVTSGHPHFWNSRYDTWLEKNEDALTDAFYEEVLNSRFKEPPMVKDWSPEIEKEWELFVDKAWEIECDGDPTNVDE